MICDVCGRDNADSLTFCQDCGRRLKGQQRVVPPTPPNGLPLVELPSSPPPPEAQAREESAPRSRPQPPAAPRPQKSRPEAPVFQFAPPPPAASPAREPEPAPPAEPNVCGSCDSPNPPDYRFCVTCGASLAKGAPHAPKPAPPRPPPPKPAQKTPVANEQIVGAPVVEIASTDPQKAKLVTCGRCHGTCVAGTKFCKFCGALLDEPGAPAQSSLDRPPRKPAITEPATPLAKTSTPRAEAVSAGPVPLVSSRNGEGAPAPASVRVLPAPATIREPTTRARLVVIVEDGSEGRSFSLEGGQLDVGRTEGDILLDDDHYVSPRHARLIFEGGRWHLRDLESTNRIYIRIRKPEPLRDGDLLLLGLEVLQFHAVSDAERGLGHATQHGTLLFGSPATARRARLSQRTVEGITRDVYHLFRDETVVGRETGDIVFTADPFLSRRHAALRRNPVTNEFFVVDLESSNGTFIAIRGETALDDGDYLRIGQHLFRLDAPPSA